MNWAARAILLFAALNLAWEVIQLPLYTIWSTGTTGEITYAILHCTAGDVMIGLALWTITRLAFRGLNIEPRSGWPLLACFILLGLGYTLFSEWMNVSVRKSWAYSAGMPLLPPFGTGLTPVLQWIIVPTLTWVTAGGRVRAKLAGRPSGMEGHAP